LDFGFKMRVCHQSKIQDQRRGWAVEARARFDELLNRRFAVCQWGGAGGYDRPEMHRPRGRYYREGGL
jgi:hypothetical protein